MTDTQTTDCDKLRKHYNITTPLGECCPTCHSQKAEFLPLKTVKGTFHICCTVRQEYLDLEEEWETQ